MDAIEEDDLTNLVECKVNFNKLGEIIQKKSNSIKQLVDDVNSLRKALEIIRETKDSTQDLLAECQERTNLIEVNMLW